MDILHHSFVRCAKLFPEKTAIIDKTIGRRVSYGRALLGSLILANTFRRFKDRYLGLMLPTSAGGILATIATLMAGKIPAMINYSTGAASNCRYASELCGFTTIVTARALLEKINCPLLPGMVCLEDILNSTNIFVKLMAVIKTRRSSCAIINAMPETAIDDTVVILFTSGSEKTPKAVQLSHANISSNLADVLATLDLTSKDRVMSILPLFHVFGHSIDLWLPMITGMTAITYSNPLDYKIIPTIIRDEGATLLAATPIFLAGYLRESKPGDFASLRLVMAGADSTPDWLRREYKKKHGIELLEGYGTTETSPVISINTPKRNKPGSIGRVLPSVEVRIIDQKSGKPLPAGQEGSILVRGNLVMKGYLNQAQTEATIVDGWYDTGDMGVLDTDSYLWHRGRLKRFVKVGGEMVSMVKVEGILQEILPPEVECCVVDVPDLTRGAAIVAAITGDIDQGRILEQLGKRLAHIEMPRKFVILDEIPKMASGKADFRTVASIIRERLEDHPPL
jgi:acyl-[acyl-carrier-protein]-phospholipid O-acyltransferase / long-chain-fatty-acid--[acyl-carrier-protein] ligase